MRIVTLIRLMQMQQPHHDRKRSGPKFAPSVFGEFFTEPVPNCPCTDPFKFCQAV